jgi:cyclophilin family peptidyl-prolyl cis-trans isomerase
MKIRSLFVLAASVSMSAGAQSLTKQDSALVARLLTAENQRDTSAAAYAEGVAHADQRIQFIAKRALARSTDARFTKREAFAVQPAPPAYTDPAWRLRYRALDPKKIDCAALRGALADSAWHVRLHAADLVDASCASDAALVKTLRGWLSSSSRMSRARNGAAWQPAAHALVALAKVQPKVARQNLSSFINNTSPWVRVYAARAAGVLSDTAALRFMMHDKNDNVKEAAIVALSKLGGHLNDNLYTDALEAKGYQAVLAAAKALKGGISGSDIRRAAIPAAYRLRKDSSETSRDARMEVMARIAEFAEVADAKSVAALATDFDCEVAKSAAAIATKLGTPTEPRCTPPARTIPADAVRLALGDDVRLKVTMSPASGGGSFVVRLRGDVAPIMAARVLALVKSRYYDNLAWHRVEPDFVIQGPSRGDNEYVGNPRFMRDELGGVPHVRGTVGMSTRGHDTGDAQWFVNLKDNLRLGRDYSVFGEVVEGIDVVDGVLEGDRIQRIEVLKGR